MSHPAGDTFPFGKHGEGEDWGSGAHEFYFDLATVDDEHPYTLEGFFDHDVPVYEGQLYLGDAGYAVSLDREGLMRTIVSGAVVQVHSAPGVWPSLIETARQRLADALGIGADLVSVSIFVGGGERKQPVPIVPHSEGNDICIIHLNGTKRYRIAIPAEAARLRDLPMAARRFPSAKVYPAYDLREALSLHNSDSRDGTKVLLSRLEPDRVEFGEAAIDRCFEPGEGVWMAAGHVHATEYMSPCVSVHFLVKSTALAQHLSLAMMETVHRSIALMRNRYPGLLTPSQKKAELASALACVDSLRVAIEEKWDAIGDYLDGDYSSSTLWMKSPRWSVRAGEAGGEGLTRWELATNIPSLDSIRGKGLGEDVVTRSLELPEEVAPLIEYVSNAGTFVSVKDAADAASLDEETAGQVFALLYTAEEFVPVSPWLNDLHTWVE